mmetsp:Transcript_3853/g.15262  ORF Transcript_3853/g.15262 Transcript_3853/m.15262 type:complete len:543 (-) Transcript_3853:124-1752(-)
MESSKPPLWTTQDQRARGSPDPEQRLHVRERSCDATRRLIATGSKETAKESTAVRGRGTNVDPGRRSSRQRRRARPQKRKTPPVSRKERAETPSCAGARDTRRGNLIKLQDGEPSDADGERRRGGVPSSCSVEVLAEVLGEFELREGVDAEEVAERVVAADDAAVGGVLQVVRLDVLPHSFGELEAAVDLRADERGELGRALIVGVGDDAVVVLPPGGALLALLARRRRRRRRGLLARGLGARLGGRGRRRGRGRPRRAVLVDVGAEELGHAEARDHVCAVEDGLEGVVAQNLRALRRVLQVVGLDVLPEQLRQPEVVRAPLADDGRHLGAQQRVRLVALGVIVRDVVGWRLLAARLALGRRRRRGGGASRAALLRRRRLLRLLLVLVLVLVVGLGRVGDVDDLGGSLGRPRTREDAPGRRCVEPPGSVRLRRRQRRVDVRVDATTLRRGLAAQVLIVVVGPRTYTGFVGEILVLVVDAVVEHPGAGPSQPLVATRVVDLDHFPSRRRRRRRFLSLSLSLCLCLDGRPRRSADDLGGGGAHR